MPELIHWQMGQRSEEDNWNVASMCPCVCEMVSMVRMAEGDAGMLGGEKSDKKETATEDASSIFAQKRKTNKWNRGKGRTGGENNSERRRETKDEK